MQEDPERLAFEQVWPKKLVKGHKKRVFGVLSLVAVKSLKNPKMKEERGARMYLKRRVVERDTRVSVYRKCEYELWKWYWRNGESGSALQDRSTTETYIVRSIIFLIYGTSTIRFGLTRKCPVNLSIPGACLACQIYWEACR